MKRIFTLLFCLAFAISAHAGPWYTYNPANVAITGGTITGITDLTVADGGTGRSTGTTAYSLVATGTTATGAQQTLANGATTEILVGGGASALPTWTTATGTGAPVRATSPTITAPIIARSASIADGTYDGNTISGVLGETVAFGELVYLKAADSKWWKAKADVTATSGVPIVGFCVIAGDADGVTAILDGEGIIRADALFDTFTISAPVFISAATAGKVVSAAPAGTTNYVVRIVGRALDGNTIRVNISPNYNELL